MINENYEGSNYIQPKNPQQFCKLMFDCQDGILDNIKKYIKTKEDTKQKLMWYSDIDAKRTYVPEQSLLSIAARYGNTEIIKYLISIGADVNDVDEYAKTPLHFACLKRKDSENNENIEAVKMLINAGADPNYVSYKKFYRIYGIKTEKLSGNGDTPLHDATRMNNIEIAKYLLNNGAKPSLKLKNNLDYTPLDYLDETYKCEFDKYIET